LTLVRSLVEMHGGTVTAYSEGEGKGTEVVVRLPLSVASEAAPSERPRTSLRKGSKVVVVEDSEDFRMMLCTFLESAGFVCKTAGDGASGLALIREIHPEAAIVDVGLPGMDGLEVARCLREERQNSDMYLLALTGYGQKADRVATRSAGFDDHLVKPVDLDELVRRLCGDESEDGADARA
jgi:two-component system CheB/CheR fusion protein